MYKKNINIIKGFVGTEKPVYNPYRAPVCLEFEAFDELLSNHEIERIIEVLDDARGVRPNPSLLEYKLRRLSIEQGLMFYERFAEKRLVEKNTINKEFLVTHSLFDVVFYVNLSELLRSSILFELWCR